MERRSGVPGLPDQQERSVKLLSSLPALALPLLAATPAHAAGGIPLPEPSSLLLLAMGVVGVAVGRRLSSKRRED
jgi:hypothetical protein